MLRVKRKKKKNTEVEVISINIISLTHYYDPPKKRQTGCLVSFPLCQTETGKHVNINLRFVAALL